MARVATVERKISVLGLLTSLGAVIGVMLGLGVALLVHWVAPADIDTVFIGAWLVFFGGVVGAVVDWVVLPGDRRR
jgi:zinc transporter ZupT